MGKSCLKFFAVLGLLVCLWPGVSFAQLISVDINSSIGRSDTTAPGFSRWDLTADLSAGTANRIATHSFTNLSIVFDPDTGVPIATNIIAIIPCTVAQVFPTAADSTIYLNANNGNKNGNSTSPDPSAGWRLSTDAVWVHQKDDTQSIDRPYTNGGAFTLTISNLTAGPHTITTYHNDVWATNVNTSWHSNRFLSHCIISVGGVPVFTNTPTFYATNDSKCGFAFFTVTNSFDGQPVVISFDPDHSSGLDFVLLNGFEVDRPNPPGTTAIAIFPSPGDEHVFANNDAPLPGTSGSGFLTLGWLPAGFAISNYVYFGTNSSAVANATTASPEFKSTSSAIVGATNTFNVTNLDSRLTYYWRVDQLDVANGVTNLAKGFIWMFRTRHLAFPTAEGYGRFARGGRGGIVMEVTNLQDYDAGKGESVIPGSYRAAIEATGPRTVIFRVSGLIRLKRPCTINNANGYLTIAGQTAPGEGICLANWRAGMSSCSDVIMRFIRCRLGDASQQAQDGIGLGNSSHSIIDHCSISWTIDEASSSRQSGAVGSGTCFITFQHNIISEPLQHSYHYDDALRASTGCTNCYQAHGFAASISGEIGSYHHNLIAHSTDRNWSLAGGLDQSSHYAGSLDIRNNVVFNWIGRTTDGGVARCNYVSNYYKPYLPNPYATWLLKLDPINTNWGTEAYYMVGNVMQGRTYFTNNWMTGSFVNDTNTMNMVRTDSEIFPSFVASQSATNAYKLVMSDVGCNLPVPDVIDRRIVGEVLDGTTHYEGTNGNPYIINGFVQPPSSNYPGIIDSPFDVHDAIGSPNYPWPAYATANVPADSDHDGLPDWWELIHGTNPNSAPGDFSDSNADPDGDGYSNLEDYLNWLSAPHVDCATSSSVDVDLYAFTRGFTNNAPVYTFSNATNGTVSLAGGRTAHFTATVVTNALGSFRFVVTDSQGTTLTNTVGVHIVVSNRPPVLTTISDRVINVGVNLAITNTASDPDVPTTFTFSLLNGPTNATLGSSSGVFNWRPLVTQANSTNPVSVVVADNGTPSLSATQSFSVTVNPLSLPAIVSPMWTSGHLSFSVDGQAGPDYGLETSTNLLSWTLLSVTNPAAMPFNWTTTNASTEPARFYRIKVGPPLP
jgi:hypothetical protein